MKLLLSVTANPRVHLGYEHVFGRKRDKRAPLRGCPDRGEAREADWTPWRAAQPGVL